MNNNCDVPAFAFCVTALPARLLWRTFSAEFAFRGVCLAKVSVRGKQKCYLLHVRYSAYHGLWMRAVVSVPCNRDEVPSTSQHQISYGTVQLIRSQANSIKLCTTVTFDSFAWTDLNHGCIGPFVSQ